MLAYQTDGVEAIINSSRIYTVCLSISTYLLMSVKQSEDGSTKEVCVLLPTPHYNWTFDSENSRLRILAIKSLVMMVLLCFVPREITKEEIIVRINTGGVRLQAFKDKLCIGF